MTPDISRMVRGQVFQNGGPLAGVVVRAFGRELRSETLLGEATTDVDGRYQISYGAGPAQIVNGDSPNLVVRVVDGGAEPLVSSPILFRAQDAETVDLVAPDVPEPEPSEYERVAIGLQPSLHGVEPADLTDDDDVGFLAGETERPAEQVAAYVAACRLHRELQAVPVAALYGLMRRGFPTTASGLTARPADDVAGALRVAIEGNLIPASLANQVDAIAQEIERVGRDQRADFLGRLLDTVPSSVASDARAKLVALADASDGPVTDVLAGLRADPDSVPASTADEAEFALKLAALTGNNLPLVAAVQERRRPGDRPARVLTTLDAASWQALVQESLKQGGEIPADVTGATTEERSAAYARRLADGAEATFPLAFLAEGLRQQSQTAVAAERSTPAKMPDLDGLGRSLPGDDGPSTDVADPIRDHLSQFFDHATDFDLAATPIDTYVETAAPHLLADLAPDDRQAVTDQLKSLQRVYQVAPKYDHMTALLDGGLDSALSVSSLSEDAFVGQFGAALGGEDAARTVHQNARDVTATATNLFATVHQAVNDVTPMALGGAAASTSLIRQFPDWATLFGRLDLCECRSCRSVYSPAAYLVDLLQFLNPRGLPSGVTQRPLDTLRVRRPDLEYIQLTCENTNTTLPYVDLVNEVLESYIALGQPRSETSTASFGCGASSAARCATWTGRSRRSAGAWTMGSWSSWPTPGRCRPAWICRRRRCCRCGATWIPPAIGSPIRTASRTRSIRSTSRCSRTGPCSIHPIRTSPSRVRLARYAPTPIRSGTGASTRAPARPRPIAPARATTARSRERWRGGPVRRGARSASTAPIPACRSAIDPRCG